MSGRRPATEAERQAAQHRREHRLQELHTRLAGQVDAVATSKDWQSYLRAAATFREYSFNNVLLILAQRPDATQVAGYDAWTRLHRQVRRGEKGIQILAPIVRHSPTAGDERHATVDVEVLGGERQAAGPDQSPGRPQVVGFRVAHVFDVSQTDGDPLPEPPRPVTLTGEVAEGLWAQLGRVADVHGWRVVRELIDGGANGVTRPAERLIRVRPDLSPAQSVKTLSHELGHALLGHGVEGAVRRKVAEVEAESVAYLVMAARGIDAGEFSFPYILDWGSDPSQDAASVVRATADRVLRTAQTILDTTAEQDTTAAAPELHELAARAARNHMLIREVADRATLSALRSRQQPAERTRTSASPVGRATHAQPADPELFVPDWKLDRLEAVNRDVATFYRDQLAAAPAVRRYLADRLGTDAGTALSEWTIGYAPRSWTAAVDYLRRRGHLDEDITAAGIATLSRHGTLIDRFRNRLMIALREDTGAYCGWIGRAVPGSPDEHATRYLNTPASPIFVKGELLAGLYEHRQILTTAVPVIVEGPLDALAIAVTAGNNGQVAGFSTSGTAVTAEHLARLDAHLPAGREIVFALDADQGGTASMERSAAMALRLDRPIYVTTLPDHHDPASYQHAIGAASLAAYLDRPHRQPALEFLIDTRIHRHADHLHWVEGQQAALHDVAQLLASFPADQITGPALQAALRLEADPVHMSNAIAHARDHQSAAGRCDARALPTHSASPNPPPPPTPSSTALAALSAPVPVHQALQHQPPAHPTPRAAAAQPTSRVTATHSR